MNRQGDRTNETDSISLQKELEQFQKEKEHIRTVIGQIGGVGATKRDRRINVIFIVAVALLFVLDVLRHLLSISVPLPPMFSLELGVLLVSIKIVWMIHKQTKVEHFQFWILSSIEFRLNDLGNQLRQMEKRLESSSRLAQERTQGGGQGQRKGILRSEIARAARMFRTNEDASRVLGVSEATFVKLCRGYGFETPAERERYEREG